MAVDTRSLDYRPVNIEKGELRLLEISAAQEYEEPIVSRLVNVKVNNDVEYVGLCALLRDPDETSSEDIWINGCRVSVPTTLSEALRNVRTLFLRDQGSLYPTTSHSSSSAAVPPPRARPKKSPGWLKHLLRGFRTILPDEGGPHARNVPLRVFLDSICMNGRNEREADQRRSYLTLAYGQAKITMGWLGPKDETSDTAIQILRQINEICPANYGTPEDRLHHPENYSPVMKLLEGFAHDLEADAKAVGGDAGKGAMFLAWTNLLARPFFNRTWIVEELTLSKFPAFLLGDNIISWMQFLKWNRINEEYEKGGCQYFPKETEKVLSGIAKLDLSIVHTLLDEFDRRRDKGDARGLETSRSSAASLKARPATSMSAGTADKLVERSALANHTTHLSKEESRHSG